MSNPPSAIVAAKDRAFDDIRSMFAKQPPLPDHHVRIEELYEILGRIPKLRRQVSCADLHDIVRGLNAHLDARHSPSPAAVGEDAFDLVELCRSFTNQRLGNDCWDKMAEADRTIYMDDMRWALTVAMSKKLSPPTTSAERDNA